MKTAYIIAWELLIIIVLVCTGVNGQEQRYKDSYSDVPRHIVDQVLNSEGWHSVTASREGLVGKKTATGHKIKADDKFVALPHRKALGRWVAIRYKDLVFVCKVRDVGPWSIQDDYWNSEDQRPLAESGKRVPAKWGKARNPAGIDLSDGLWDWLGIRRGVGLVDVKWKFIKRTNDE